MEPRPHAWTLVGFAAAVVLAAAWLLTPARYEMHVTSDAVYRLDRYTGHVDASATATLRQAPWATIVGAP